MTDPYKTLAPHWLAPDEPFRKNGRHGIPPKMRAPRAGFYIDRQGDVPRMVRISDAPEFMKEDEAAQWSHRQLLFQGGYLQMVEEKEWWGIEVIVLAHHMPSFKDTQTTEVEPEFPPPPGVWLLRDGANPMKLDMMDLLTHGRAKVTAAELRRMEVEQAFLRAGKMQHKDDREWMIVTVDVIWHSKTDVSRTGG